MKRLILISLLLLPSLALSAGGGIELKKAHNNLHDTASLQRGAKLFVNYCMGCHSVEYSRYQRIGKDLGLTDTQLKENLMFNTEKVGELMHTSMKPQDAKKWFGVVPPDLSVVARSRGTDWLYTYFMTFYLDPSKPLGVNNLAFKDVGMPHVLWDLQGGWQEMVHEKVGSEAKSHAAHATPQLKLVSNLPEKEQQQKKVEYQRAVRDLVNFLEYVGEPAKIHRLNLGWKVILFLFIFLIVAYMLKKEYWKDIH